MIKVLKLDFKNNSLKAFIKIQHFQKLAANFKIMFL